jgi:hypothetical protein
MALVEGIIEGFMAREGISDGFWQGRNLTRTHTSNSCFWADLINLRLGLWKTITEEP